MGQGRLKMICDTKGLQGKKDFEMCKGICKISIWFGLSQMLGRIDTLLTKER
jgi:hypothetical protein